MTEGPGMTIKEGPGMTIKEGLGMTIKEGPGMTMSRGRVSPLAYLWASHQRSYCAG